MPHPNLEPRVASLEAGLKSLGESLEKLASSMESQNSAILRKLDASGRPQYALLVSILGLVVAVVTALGGAFIMPLKNDISHQTMLLSQSENRLIKEVEKLDERLQRETSLVLKEVAAKFEAVNQASLERFNQNQKEVTRINKWQDLLLEERLHIPQSHSNGNNGAH